MTIETTLQQHLPASLKKQCDEIQEIAAFYEDYIEMKGRDDLFKLQGEIESAEIYVEHSIDVVISKYINTTDEHTLKSTKVRVVLT